MGADQSQQESHSLFSRFVRSSPSSPVHRARQHCSSMLRSQQASLSSSRCDKRKLLVGFATIRRKLQPRSKRKRLHEQVKAFRELLTTWSPGEVSSLVAHYDALASLMNLTVQAASVRPPASSVVKDMGSLFEEKYYADIDLVFQGECFPLHRAILCARCSYFRNLMATDVHHSPASPRLLFNLEIPGFDSNQLLALLRYIYTGDYLTSQQLSRHMLQQLRSRFGSLNAVQQDLKYLLETGLHADALLVFGSEPAAAWDAATGTTEDAAWASPYGDQLDAGFKCHKAILCARSQFFRKMIARRFEAGIEASCAALGQPSLIVLDERIVPRRYGPVLLHALYLDEVDLSLIENNKQSAARPAGRRFGGTRSLSEAEAISMGKGGSPRTPWHEAMELHQIGQFLELACLVQGCEDIIAGSLSLETLVPILEWSSQPHGSAWVQRQAMRFLVEQFPLVAKSPVLNELSLETMLEALDSDFLQGSELGVVSVCVRWAENQLMRQMEEREPNVVSHTSHSVSKKGVKRKDLSSSELREILAPLLPCVRLDHVVPAHADLLSSCIKRGLMSLPPSHMLDDSSRRANPWLVSSSEHAPSTRPRLYWPYVEEAKRFLEEQSSQFGEIELLRLRLLHRHDNMPDTLYMVHAGSRSGDHDEPFPPPPVDDDEALPSSELVEAVLQREQELSRSSYAARAYGHLNADRVAIGVQLRLWAARELGLPDQSAWAIARSHPWFISHECPGRYQVMPSLLSSTPGTHPLRRMASTPPASTKSKHSEPVMARSVCYWEEEDLDLDQSDCVGLLTRRRDLLKGEQDSLDESGASLREAMPDVAMATAAIDRLHLSDGGVPLDCFSDPDGLSSADSTLVFL